MNGMARAQALNQLATQVDEAAAGSSNAGKVNAIAATLRELAK
jgi:hypothetical protein